MTSTTTKSDSSQPAAETTSRLFDNWFDPIEAGLRDRVRDFIKLMFEGELDEALLRMGLKRQLLPSGTVSRRNAARCTSTATCWRMRPNACTRKSTPITPI